MNGGALGHELPPSWNFLFFVVKHIEAQNGIPGKNRPHILGAPMSLTHYYRATITVDDSFPRDP
jgi:hypothetical protein